MKLIDRLKNYFVLFMVTVCLYLSYICLTEVNKINDRLDRADVEFKFVVTDTMMTVYDGNDVVGTVKVQGQLDSLLVDYLQ